MTNLHSLISLCHTLSKPEKKKVAVTADHAAAYYTLYSIIVHQGISDPKQITGIFSRNHPRTSIYITASYLYGMVLDCCERIKKQKDTETALLSMIGKARILYDKAMPEEAIDMLEKVRKEAEKFEMSDILYLCRSAELDYLLGSGYPGLSEAQLLAKQTKLASTLNDMRKLRELRSLYELLNFRTLNKGEEMTEEFTKMLNDLVMAEMRLVADPGKGNFEIRKIHKLFQSLYLMESGNYRSAVRSYRELVSLFDEHSELWQSPPVFYLRTLEGICESLRAVGAYDDALYFAKLMGGIQSGYSYFDYLANMTSSLSIIKIYMDQGRYGEVLDAGSSLAGAGGRYTGSASSLHDEASFITALACFCSGDDKKCLRLLRSPYYSGLSESRAPGLLRILANHRLGNTDLTVSLCRSLKRKIRGKPHCRTERLVIAYTETPHWKKKDPDYAARIAGKCRDIRQSKYEIELLKVFDFTLWIESDVSGVPPDQLSKNNAAVDK